MRRRSVLFITQIAVFAALSTVLYFLTFPLPPFPSFLKIQFSNLPAVIGGFALGPIGGLIIILVRTLIALPFSSSQYVGELADFLIGGSAVLVSSLFYKKFHTFKGGILALGCGMITWVGVSILANRFILVPFYMTAFKMTANDFVQILSAVPWSSIFKTITVDNYMSVYIVCCTIPFNLIISLVVSLVTLLVYKRISNFLKKFSKDEDEKKA